MSLELGYVPSDLDCEYFMKEKSRTENRSTILLLVASALILASTWIAFPFYFTGSTASVHDIAKTVDALQPHFGTPIKSSSAWKFLDQYLSSTGQLWVCAFPKVFTPKIFTETLILSSRTRSCHL